jgi:hypothetical protein
MVSPEFYFSLPLEPEHWSGIGRRGSIFSAAPIDLGTPYLIRDRNPIKHGVLEFHGAAPDHFTMISNSRKIVVRAFPDA